MRLPTTICLLACPLLASAAVAQPLISTFDTDAEGWMTDLDARDFEWRETGGNPGGYVHAVDIGSGQYWRFEAPALFLGDLSARYGQTLSYELIQTGIVGSVTTQPDVILEGGGVRLVKNHGAAPSSEWTGFAVTLDVAGDWRLNSVGGQPADEAAIRGVLADVSALLIRGEFRVGADAAGLDNVVLGTPCPAELTGDGVLDLGDVQAFVALFLDEDPAADFNPDGVLDNGDISAFVAAFLAGC
ncbi:MAG: laminin B domain-containing protein [Phycisphaerales bacterium JB040]